MQRRSLYVGILLLLLVSANQIDGYPTAKLANPTGDIIFPHVVHVENSGIECRTCHGTIDSSRSATDNNLPDMTVCGGCHESVNDDTLCGACHRQASEPSTYADVKRPIAFNHAKHLAMKLTCEACHEGVSKSDTSQVVHMPSMALCLQCHNGVRADASCTLCHSGQITLSDIHPVGWRHEHGQQANANPGYCTECHQQQTSCVACHRGDNLTGKVHDLNYRYTHGLDAQSKAIECRQCHDERTFCDECHIAERRMPLNHSRLNWRSEHGAAARTDPENCAACHDQADPTCARVGCHNDFDGILGTAPAIHREAGDFKFHGPWHSDRGYFCYQCHTNTSRRGEGFCGYCHGGGD